MVQRRQHADLPQKTVEQLGVALEVGQQHLHRLDTLRNDVADLVDAAHPAGAQNFKNFVIADNLADCVFHGAPPRAAVYCPGEATASPTFGGAPPV